MLGIVGSGLNHGIGMFGSWFWIIFLPWAFAMFWGNKADRRRFNQLCFACMLGVLGFFWSKESSSLWFPCIGQTIQTPYEDQLSIDSWESKSIAKPLPLPLGVELYVERVSITYPDMGYKERYIARSASGLETSFSLDDLSAFPKASMPKNCINGTVVSKLLHALTWLAAGPFILIFIVLISMQNF